MLFNYSSAVAAVFSLAYKLQPAIIFIDEVDSFLGQRRTTDHEALTNMKTEFMALWDGFTTDRKSLFFFSLNSTNLFSFPKKIMHFQSVIM